MNTETENLTPTQVYKNRVAAITDKLPDNYREIVFQHYPEYNTSNGGNLVSNVKTGRSAHVRLTGILERIASGELKYRTQQ